MSRIIVEFIGGPYDRLRLEDLQPNDENFHLYYLFRDKQVGSAAYVTSELGMQRIDAIGDEMNEFETEEEALAARKLPAPLAHWYRVEERTDDGDTVTVRVKYFVPDEDNVSSPLYHYCGVNGFKGILEGKCLWLSHVYYMNDYKEHKWLIEKARSHWTELKLKDDPSLERSFSEDPCGFTDIPFICCFSTEGDLLSQWRAYSDDGAGFAIGFSGEKLQERLLSLRSDEAELELAKVIYEEEHQDAEITKAISKSLKAVKEFQQHKDDPKKRLHVEGAIDNAQYRIWRTAARCKNHGFQEEQEWRVIFFPPLGWDGEIPDISIQPICFRATGNSQFVPYFKLPFEPEMISEIRLGPKNSARKDHETIKFFLTANGYPSDKIEIANSEATYR